MAELYRVDSPITREQRNNLNATFADIQQEIGNVVINTGKIKDDVKGNLNGLQSQINTLVVEGDSSPEAAQARVDNIGHIYSTLKERLDVENLEVSEKIEYSTYKPLSDFGILGDGSVETSKLQQAIDYARTNNAILFTNKPMTIIIDSPIYVDGKLKMDCNYLNIKKNNSSIGSGSNLQRNGAFVDNYDKDAVFILRHPDEGFTFSVHIKGVKFENNGGANAIGIYAPFMAESSFDNVLFSGVKNGIFGYCWYLIERMNNIKMDSGEYALRLVDDGTGIGSSTSLNADNIYTTDSLGCFDLFGLSYSNITIPMSDRPTGVPFVLRYCNSVNVNSPSTEYTQKGGFLNVQGGEVIVNSPRCFNPKASDQNTESAIFRVSNGANLIVNGGIVSNYTDMSGNSFYSNFPVYVNGGKLQLNATKMPSNAQPFFLNLTADVIHQNNGNDINKITKTDTINAFSKGITESGTNANGSYIKFDDGTMIQTIETTQDCTIGLGSIFRSGDLSIPLPVPFLNNNYEYSAGFKTATFAMYNITENSNSDNNFFRFRLFGTATSTAVLCKITLTGKWK